MTEISMVPSPFRASHDLWELARGLGSWRLPSTGYNDPITRGRLPWFKRALDRSQIIDARIDRLLDFSALEVAAQSRWPHGAVVTERLLVNVMGPMKQLPPHVDPPTFDGVSQWAVGRARESGFAGSRTLLGVMSRSGLFERWRARTISGVLWGDFTSGGDYLIWAGGRDGRPIRIPASARYCVLADNERLYHGFSEVGTSVQQGELPALDPTSTLSIEDDQVTITGAHRPYRGLVGHSFRVSAVWQARSAELSACGELSLEQVVAVFTEDLRRRGVSTVPVEDPVADGKWIRTLLREYGF